MPLSYAERAKRASAAAAIAAASAKEQPQNGRTVSLNGSVQPVEGSVSSRTSNSGSSVVVTQPASPPISLSSTSAVDDAQAFPPIPKSPSKPPPNVWAARREQQIARVAAQGQGDAIGTKMQTERTTAPSRSPLNGILNTQSRDEHANTTSSATVDDPFVVRMPNQSRSPPSLDDPESWPVMSNPPGPSTTTSTAPSVAGESSSGTSAHKKGMFKVIHWISLGIVRICIQPFHASKLHVEVVADTALLHD